jgi:hypothetical protein
MRGHRNEWGGAYRRVYEEIQKRYGTLFIKRNAEGRLRQVTPAARLKEAEALAPSNANRHPIVAITHYSNAEGDEVPTYFSLIYSDVDTELVLTLFLDLAEQTNQQLLDELRNWVRDLPIFCGTASPAFAHDSRAKDTVVYKKYLTARAGHPGFQFVPHPPIGGYFDGVPNWGPITILGEELVAKLGDHDTILRTVPSGFAGEFLGKSLLLSSSQFTCHEPASRLTSGDRLAFQSLADFLAPCRNSSYSDGYIPMEEWNRLTTDWDGKAKRAR